MRLIHRSLPFLLLAAFALLPAHAGKKPPEVFLRVYVQTAGEGLGPAQATSVPIPPNGEIIQVRTIPEVSEHDLVDVKSTPDKLILILNHRGKVNLDAATGQNQGRLMVVMLNGTVIYAPVIDEQITDGILVIPRALPPEIIALLQQTAKDNVKNGPPQLAPSNI